MTLVLEKIPQRCKVIFALGAVDPVIDGNKADILLGKYNFSVHPSLQIVPAKAGHILDHHHAYKPRLNISQHLLEARTIES